MAFQVHLGLLELLARMVLEEFPENREFRGPKDLQEPLDHVAGSAKRVLKGLLALLDSLGFLERMEAMVHLVLQDLPDWMELLDHRVPWAHLANKVYKERQEQQDLGV